MSSPPRIITPRLEAAIQRAVARLDESIEAGETALATMAGVLTMHATTAAREELDGDKALRAELLEAFDQAIAGRDGWISCAERKPHKYTWYPAVQVGDTRWEMALYQGEDDEWGGWRDSRGRRIDVARWFDVPAPAIADPKETEE